MKRPILIVAAATLVLVCGLIAAPAHANHAPSFGPTWQHDLTPTWHFTPSVPAGSWRSRINDGVRQWNNLNESLTYVGSGDLPNRNPLQGCGPRDDAVTMHRAPFGDGGGGTLGISSYCYYSSGATGRADAFILFDEDEEWCLGTGDCYDGVLGSGIGANIDLWSVAAHEMGHVSAIGHFSGSDDVCDDDGPKNTMCPTYSAGSEQERSLEGHDIGSFRLRY